MKHHFLAKITGGCFAAAVLIFLGLPSGASAAAAALVPGDLIKLTDDGNPATTSDAAVYYYGADSKRYVFPNSQAYFTWYSDFSGVKTISAAAMASLPLGGNVTYRPGTRLVKITSDPNVYAVEPGGVLRWIQSESVARSLYGDGWNQRVDDIPDAFFLNYRLGDPLAAAVYPDGTIVKRASDGAFFRIENRTKRRLTLADPKTVLRLQDQFIITVSSTLADYPDAADVTTAEAAIIDVSQKNLVAAPATPTFTVRLPASHYIAVGGDATLLELHVASAQAVVVRQLAVRLEATTGVPAAGVTDDDLGGLVYGNNSQSNLRLLRWVDAQGHEPFGRAEIALDTAQDQAQTFVFTGSFQVPSGTDQVLYFRAQLNDLLPTGEGYRAVWLASGAAVNDAATGAALIFAPSSDLTGASLSSLNATLEVSVSGTPGLVTYVRGTKDAALSGLTFKATTLAPNVIKAATFQGFIDAEGNNSFIAGADSYGGAATRVSDLVPTVSLYDSQGVKLGGPMTVDLDGRVAFTGLTYSIPPGQSAILIIKGDISPTIDLSVAPKTLFFDINDAAADLAVVDDKGAKINASGQLPAGGPTAVRYAKVKQRGEAKFRWIGSGGRVIAGREILLGTLAVATKDDVYDLKTVSFRQVGAAAKSMTDVRLEYPAANGQPVSVAKQFLGDSVTFSGLSARLDKDKTTELKFYGRVASRVGGAVYGEQLTVQFNAAGALELVSQADGSVFSEKDLGSSTSDFGVTDNVASSGVVRFSLLTAVKSTAQPTAVYHDTAADVIDFSFRAEAEGAVRVKKMTFKILPGDAGKEGADNDALERWAKLNGDFANDVVIADLKQVVGTTENLIGEDASTRLQYSVVHNGVKNAYPVASNYVSSGGDYALLEYTFNDGAELGIGPNGNQAFSFSLDTGAFASDNNYALSVELMGGADFLWTDVPSGAYTALTGYDAAGLPQGNSVTVKT